MTNVDVYVRGPNGAPLEEAAMVMLSKLQGGVYRQGTTKSGHVRFSEVAKTEYTIWVVAPGFVRASKQVDAHSDDSTKVTVDMLPAPEGQDAAFDQRIAILPPKTQLELSKAVEALNKSRTSEARSHLDAVARTAPNLPELNYFYGVYASQMKDWEQAKSYWTKTIDLYPKHFLALLALGQALLNENKPAEALPYLKRATQIERSSWRAEMYLADAELRQGAFDDAIKAAERALELGQEKAAAASRIEAAALAKRGDKDRATDILKAYVHDHSSDADAKKQLENLLAPGPKNPSGDVGVTLSGIGNSKALREAYAPPPPGWLPPDVDAKVPPVEPGASCFLDEVVQKAGKRVQEFVENVDRFAATESLFHQSVTKTGDLAAPETRIYDYLVSLEQPKPNYYIAEEFRSVKGSAANFPDGIATNGLSAMVLIFHPSYAKNYDMTCEGLAQWKGGLAWQLHFIQRPDKPNTMRAYRNRLDGPVYFVALKGRAWISADTYQVVGLETDMVKPIPDIRLFADHAAIEYGPVQFQQGKVDMWLPLTAEVYFDWMGRRIHRRHSFSNYLLFGVENHQRILDPKIPNPPPETPPF